jgi:hypothetical protein
MLSMRLPMRASVSVSAAIVLAVLCWLCVVSLLVASNFALTLVETARGQLQSH